LLPGLVGLSCTSQPTILPSRDLERPTDMAFVCMGAFDPSQPAAPADGGADPDAGGQGPAPAEADAAPAAGSLVLSGRPMRECHPRMNVDPAPGVEHRTFGFVPNSASGQL